MEKKVINGINHKLSEQKILKRIKQIEKEKEALTKKDRKKKSKRLLERDRENERTYFLVMIEEMLHFPNCTSIVIAINMQSLRSE